jgi:CBS domain-containing protein
VATAPLVLAATQRFLRGHLPFSAMSDADLEFLVGAATLGYFPVDTLIVDGRSAPDEFYILSRGHVARRGAGAELVIGPGECFPVGPLLSGAGGGFDYRSTEDAFCYVLPKATFEALRARSAPFAEFCTRELAMITARAFKALSLEFSQRANLEDSLLKPLGSLIRRAPVACRATTALREALATMQAERVRSIVVVDERARPLGIFTLSDLLERVVLAGLPLERPVAQAMSAAPAELDELATAETAIALLAERAIHQLIVTREGRLAGVLSERDLFALQRVSLSNILALVERATLAELKNASCDIAEFTDNLIAQGVGAGPLMLAITALRDAVTARLFRLLWPAELPVRWCWLALGSEGRREQTVASDQDNALIFDGADPDAGRALLLPRAQELNLALAELGAPLCPGKIMAMNPDCCLSLAEWRARFAGWIREPTPEALLAANIYFDFRPLAGEAALAETLRAYVLEIARGSRLFQGLIVDNARLAEPPLGRIRVFRVEGQVLDLKREGTRLFVDAARALALALALPETNTAQRLRAGARALNVEARDAEAWIGAFEYLQMLRLRRQRAGQGDGLDPYALSELDQRMLKAAFLEAKGLQELIAAQIGR